MKLADLLNYNSIVIQCHDNPDADTIASGFGVYTYLKSMNKNVSLIYGGNFEVKKSNLKLMISELNIPLTHVTSQENIGFPDLLITVDCQYGEGNVQKFTATNIAIIDHHQISGDLPDISEIRSDQNSCSTIVWDMLRNEGNPALLEDLDLGTALYYGLMTDTNNFTEIYNPLDRELLDTANFRESDIVRFKNSSISLEELRIAGTALLGYEYNENYRFALVEAKPCDPSILGIISDMMLEVDSVDTCLVYTVLDFGVKYSVRSCITEDVKANELAEYISTGLGSGGGHLVKAGGLLQRELMEKKGFDYDTIAIKALLYKILKAYFSK